MTIQVENGWVQYDNQIGTFRGELNGVVYGTYTNEHQTAESLIEAMNIEIDVQQLADLVLEKGE